MATGNLSQPMSFSTPILFITYKRLDTAFQVFNTIASIQPAKLYFASNLNKPDHPEDFDEILQVRSLLDKVNWPCEVHTRYPEVHLNVQESIYNAITWFFQHEESGIILEDDCVPHEDFYFYCQDLLHRYRDDSRVWAISGNCFLQEPTTFPDSYYFSKYFHCWGWASWRRSWEDFDLKMSTYPLFLNRYLRLSLFDSVSEAAYWILIWNRIYRHGLPLTWDYQFYFHIFSNSGLIAAPSQNLVKNIGFRSDAENTTSGSSPLPKVNKLLPLKHPEFILRNRHADRRSFRTAFFENSFLIYIKYVIIAFLMYMKRVFFCRSSFVLVDKLYKLFSSI